MISSREKHSLRTNLHIERAFRLLMRKINLDVELPALTGQTLLSVGLRKTKNAYATKEQERRRRWYVYFSVLLIQIRCFLRSHLKY